MVHADGSILQTFEYLKQNGVDGLKTIWPMPTPIAWKIIACFGAFEAFLQLALPGKRFEGPISPAGNVPVYKVSVMCCCLVSLFWWMSALVLPISQLQGVNKEKLNN